MERIFYTIPNRAFDRIVRPYALQKGKRAFSLRDLDSALINYIYHARKNN
jgi:hypothetical protein